MDNKKTKDQLAKALESLRGEITELRAVETMHKQTQKELQAIELHLAGIIHSAMDAIITCNEGQRIVLFNEAAEQMFGCSTSEAIGQPIDRFIPERFRAAHREHIHDFGETNVTNRRMGGLGIIVGLRANGEEFPIEASISQVEVEGKKLFTVILRDITQRKRLEEQLQKTERLAELGTLASGMAHEIGTPMNVILGQAEFLMRKVSEETTKKGLETIVTQVERITKIMNQLLSFARRRPIERRPIDLALVVNNMLEMVQEQVKKHQIQVETTLDTNGLKVSADADQMSQVLLNLVLNAIQAMPNCGTLRISIKPVGAKVELIIADTGCGIPEANLSKLFDPFFTTKDVGEGTGLGLTVAHGIIQEHEGSITVDSQPGKGATFHIFLPAHESSVTLT